MYRIREKTNKRRLWELKDGTGLVDQINDSCAPSTRLGGRIAKTGDKIRAQQHLANQLSLDADTPPVNDAQHAKAETPRLNEVLFHHGLYVARGDSMQVEYVGDRNTDRVPLGFHRLETKKPGPHPGPG